MFLTVTPNLCIERTIELPVFQTGEVHRVPAENVHVNAGGKGINAARVAAELGSEVLALSWVGKFQKAWFEKQLLHEGVAHDLIEVESDTRICTNILHGILHGDHRKTEVVEAGAPFGESDGARMLEKFDALLPGCNLAAICGSYPPGASTTANNSHLTNMSRKAREHGKKLLVDGKGAAFKSLLQSTSPPWAIKPNCEEAGVVLNRTIDNEADERRAVDELLHFGVEVVLLSCGARGAYLGTSGSTHFFTPPRIKEISAVGSGDAFVGAFAAQYLQEGDLVDAVRWGVAAGAASASQKLSAFCTHHETESLLPQVVVRQLS